MDSGLGFQFSDYPIGSASPFTDRQESPFQQPEEEFPRFSHVFIKIAKAIKLIKCESQSLFLLIRIRGSIPPFQTPNSWCSSGAAEFNFGYALDFTGIPPFKLSDFTPVIEVHRKLHRRSELVGISLLPMTVRDVEMHSRQPITFIYRDTEVSVTDCASQNVLGTLIVTLAFGFPCHRPLFQSQAPIPGPIPEPKAESVAPVAEIKHRKKRKRTQWRKIAIAMGWNQPGFVADDWRLKAKKNGWIPPGQVIYSSVHVSCNIDDLVTLKDASTQTERVIVEFSERSNSCLLESGSDHQLDDLIGILNQRKTRTQDMTIMPSKCIFERSDAASRLAFVNHGVLFHQRHKEMISRVEPRSEDAALIDYGKEIKLDLDESILEPYSLLDACDDYDYDDTDSSGAEVWRRANRTDADLVRYRDILHGL
jgi:hypothetical protein